MFKYKKITLIITLVLVFLGNLLIYASSINDEEVFIKNGSRDKKLIALTFDDGPHPKETNQVLDILNKYKVTGVIHSFSGSYETACIYIKMGYLLGINGVITFKNCNLKDVVEKLDLGNIVLETDSPYLTPVPYRGKRNDPSHVWEIAEYIADLKVVSVEELSKETNGNIARCFDI